MDANKVPIIGDDGSMLLGYISESGAVWTCSTVFGYVMTRTEDQASAEKFIRSEGLKYLQGLWQYFDEDKKTWFPCVLKEALDNRVVIVRTNEMGVEDPELYKQVVLKDPSETNLQKA